MLSSQEIRTIITALGTGIGEGDYDHLKLRYHRIIIMTDADVDGSHIRTLLLTFFYRQMPQIIEHNHLYIAQPPLYKVKKGKTEAYLSNDDDLNRYLMEQASQERAVKQGAAGARLEGKELRHLLERLTRHQMHSELLRKRGFDPAIVEALIAAGLHDSATFESAERLGRIREAVEAAGFRTGDLDRDEEHGRYTFEVEGGQRAKAATLVSWDLVSSIEYRTLQTLDAELKDLKTPPFIVAENGHETSVASRRELLEYLMEEGKKGVSIQRYKGLGEMNPGQLWETTMNPGTRHMLQVSVADAVEADMIFTVLMGDTVEPRRKFIEDNALDVRNLDI
jgi:DNA gyrase subunit B